MVRAQGRARLRLLVGAMGDAWLNGCRCDLPEDMRAKGRRDPGRRTMAGALGVLFGVNPAVLLCPAPVLEPLAAVVLAEHKGCGFDTHAGEAASCAPRCGPKVST